MSNLGKAIAGLATAMTLAAGASASAAIITTTYTGHVITGYDQTGRFGEPGALDNASFTAVFTTDDTTPGAVHQSVFSTDGIRGGTHTGTGDPTTGVLTINGRSLNFDTGYEGVTLVSNRYDGQGHSDLVRNDAFEIIQTEYDPFVQPIFQRIKQIGFGVRSFIHDFVPATDYHAPFTYIPDPADEAVGFFLDSYEEFGPQPNPDRTPFKNYADFRVTSVTVTSSTAPEPATWALMLGGFGMAGASLRRRRVCA